MHGLRKWGLLLAPHALGFREPILGWSRCVPGSNIPG